MTFVWMSEHIHMSTYSNWLSVYDTSRGRRTSLGSIPGRDTQKSCLAGWMAPRDGEEKKFSILYEHVERKDERYVWVEKLREKRQTEQKYEHDFHLLSIIFCIMGRYKLAMNEKEGKTKRKMWTLCEQWHSREKSQAK